MGATATYVRASLAEVATALTALTGEPHPLAIKDPGGAAAAAAKPLDNACPGPTAVKCRPSTLNRLEDHNCGAVSP